MIGAGGTQELFAIRYSEQCARTLEAHTLVPEIEVVAGLIL